MDEIQISRLMNYLREEFPEPMQYHFTYDLVENVIRHADMNMSRDMVIYHISEMIPEVTMDEIVKVLDAE